MTQDIPRQYYRAFPRQGYFIPPYLIWLWMPLHGAEAWRYAMLNRN